MDHFHELSQLGEEVRATKVVATLVDGAVGTVNYNNNEEDIYLPTSDGYRPCYYCYLKSLGYSAKPNASGVTNVTWDGPGNMADASNYVSLSTYVTVVVYVVVIIVAFATTTCPDVAAFASAVTAVIVFVVSIVVPLAQFRWRWS
jgi:hypothetical protein